MKTYYFITPYTMHVIEVNNNGNIFMTCPVESDMAGLNFQEAIKMCFMMSQNCKVSLYEVG